MTIGKGTKVTDSTLKDTIVGEGSTLERVDLHDSLLGSHAVVKGVKGVLSLSDHSEVMGQR